MKIYVKDTISEYCLSEEDGRRLFYIIKSNISSGNTAELNFFLVRVCSSFFIETLFMNLLKEYNKSTINEKIKFISCYKGFDDSIPFYIDLFDKYNKSPKFRKELDEKYFRKGKTNEKKSRSKKIGTTDKPLQSV